MKKGQVILLSICALSICVVFGIFLGRNLPSHYVQPEQSVTRLTENTQSDHAETIPAEKVGLDLNTATMTQLMELPGIGEVLAQRILEYRQTNGSFITIDELLNVKGIGEKKLEELEPFVKIGG